MQGFATFADALHHASTSLPNIASLLLSLPSARATVTHLMPRHSFYAFRSHPCSLRLDVYVPSRCRPPLLAESHTRPFLSLIHPPIAADRHGLSKGYSSTPFHVNRISL